MPNPNQPTISLGATGNAVRRLQRALRRTPNLGLVVDGIFGPVLNTAVKEFQQGAGLAVDGIVGPLTWAALPNGAPMPTLREGSTGAAVRSLQQVRSMATSVQIPRPRFRRFRPGAALRRTVSLVIKRGPSRCMRRAQPWSPPSVFNMQPEESWRSYPLSFHLTEGV
jgi:hypothetical protein